MWDSLTGYAYNLLTYFGKETSYGFLNGGQSEMVFKFQLRPLATGHVADIYYIIANIVSTAKLNMKQQNLLTLAH